MELELNYYTQVKYGRLPEATRKKIASELSQFEGKKIEIRVKRLRSTRSLQQNRYWWLCMGILSEHTGFRREEIHNICKFKFLKRERVIESTGEVMEYLESTTKLTKGEFMELTDAMIKWAAESLNVVIPEPGQQLEIDTE